MSKRFLDWPVLCVGYRMCVFSKMKLLEKCLEDRGDFLKVCTGLAMHAKWMMTRLSYKPTECQQYQATEPEKVKLLVRNGRSQGHRTQISLLPLLETCSSQSTRTWTPAIRIRKSRFVSGFTVSNARRKHSGKKNTAPASWGQDECAVNEIHWPDQKTFKLELGKAAENTRAHTIKRERRRMSHLFHPQCLL